jgi:hypothetical protein
MYNLVPRHCQTTESNLMHNEERVRQRAYELWEQQGKPEGCESEHWEQACREIEAEGSGPPAQADMASNGLGPAADALREVAGSPVNDADTGLNAAGSDTEQSEKMNPEKVGEAS